LTQQYRSFELIDLINTIYYFRI